MLVKGKRERVGHESKKLRNDAHPQPSLWHCVSVRPDTFTMHFASNALKLLFPTLTFRFCLTLSFLYTRPTYIRCACALSQRLFLLFFCPYATRPCGYPFCSICLSFDVVKSKQCFSRKLAEMYDHSRACVNVASYRFYFLTEFRTWHPVATCNRKRILKFLVL